MVTVLVLLLSACSDKENQQAIEAMESAISVIDLDELDESVIADARTAYDALSEELKSKVENHQIRTDAEDAVLQRIEERKKTELESLRALFDSGISECVLLRDVVIQVWGDAIHKGMDFNAALNALYKGKEYYWTGLSEELASAFKDGISLLKENYVLIEEQLEIVKNLEVDENVYNALADVFREYTVFYNQVISPSGSYTSFSSDTSDAYNKDILRAYANLELVWPY